MVAVLTVTAKRVQNKLCARCWMDCLQEVLKVLVNNTQLLLNTTPYSEYNVSVATKPSDYGTWSDSVFIVFRTLSAGIDSACVSPRFFFFLIILNVSLCVL